MDVYMTNLKYPVKMKKLILIIVMLLFVVSAIFIRLCLELEEMKKLKIEFHNHLRQFRRTIKEQIDEDIVDHLHGKQAYNDVYDQFLIKIDVGRYENSKQKVVRCMRIHGGNQQQLYTNVDECIVSKFDMWRHNYLDDFINSFNRVLRQCQNRDVKVGDMLEQFINYTTVVYDIIQDPKLISKTVTNCMDESKNFGEGLQTIAMERCIVDEIFDDTLICSVIDCSLGRDYYNLGAERNLKRINPTTI